MSVEATKRLNKIRSSLPADIDEPVVLKRSAEEYPVIEIAVTGKQDAADLHAMAENTFKEKLQQAEGVADVSVTGGAEKEIAVLVNQEKLNYYSLTLKDITDAIRNENTMVSAGSVYSENRQIYAPGFPV